MGMSASWHADDRLLATYVRGDAGPVRGASLEQHLTHCAACRTRIATHVEVEPLEAIWSRIQEQAQAPDPGRVHKVLSWLGISEESGRLLTAVSSMRGGWLLGVTVALMFAGLAAFFSEDLGISAFLLVAPLAPIAGVAAAFGGDADPSHEIVTTTPYSAGRLLLLRTVAVLAACTPIAMVVGLLLPGPAWLTVAWLSPATAGIAVTLALAPAVGLMAAATSVAAVWTTLSLATTRALDPLALVGLAGQLACLCLVAACGAVICSKSPSFDLPRRP
jgi:anti-sigma factor RsiW